MLREVKATTRAQRALIAEFRDGQQIGLASEAGANEKPIPVSNLAVSIKEPGYSELYAAHLAGNCWYAEPEDLLRGSALRIGIEDVEATLFVSCPVGEPLRGALSVSFDYAVESPQEKAEILRELTPQFEPLLAP